MRAVFLMIVLAALGLAMIGQARGTLGLALTELTR